MTKILITGSFAGVIEVVFGDSGVGADAFPPLLSVDLSGAVLTDRQKSFLIAYLPVRYGAGFAQSWGTEVRLQFAEETMELDFENDFWKPYGHKINKPRCLDTWGKMSRSDRGLAVARIGAYMRYLLRKGVGKADPENYLKKRYFNNDYDNID